MVTFFKRSVFDLGCEFIGFGVFDGCFINFGGWFVGRITSTSLTRLICKIFNCALFCCFGSHFWCGIWKGIVSFLILVFLIDVFFWIFGGIRSVWFGGLWEDWILVRLCFFDLWVLSTIFWFAFFVCQMIEFVHSDLLLCFAHSSWIMFLLCCVLFFFLFMAWVWSVLPFCILICLVA